MQDLHSTSYLPRAEPSTRPGGVSRSRTEPWQPRAKGPAAGSTLTPVRACQPSGILESTAPPTGIYRHLNHLRFLPRSFAGAQYSGHMSSLFFEEIYCFFLKKCNLNTPPGKSIFSNIFRRSIFLFQRYHYFVIGIQLMFIQ